MSDGRSGIRNRTSGISAAAASETVITTGFQPPVWASAAMAGRKTSEPVAVDALSRPITNPRCLTNQRFTTVAPMESATAPLARPESTPQVATYWQGWAMKRLSAVEALIRMRPASRVRFRPMVCIRAAATGPTRP